MSCYQLFYVSRLSQSLSLAQVRVLVGQAQVANRRAGIGGLLTFTGDHFAQILEGDEPAVQQLAARIAADPRHTHFRVVHESRDRTQPEYAGWAMQLMASPGLDHDIARLLDDRPEGPADAAGILARIKEEATWQSG